MKKSEQWAIIASVLAIVVLSVLSVSWLREDYRINLDDKVEMTLEEVRLRYSQYIFEVSIRNKTDVPLVVGDTEKSLNNVRGEDRTYLFVFSTIIHTVPIGLDLFSHDRLVGTAMYYLEPGVYTIPPHGSIRLFFESSHRNDFPSLTRLVYKFTYVQHGEYVDDRHLYSIISCPIPDGFFDDIQRQWRQIRLNDDYRNCY